jgi:hypothetical protein
MGSRKDFTPQADRDAHNQEQFARRIFSVMDDIFYGERPKPEPASKWTRFDTK